MSIAKSFVKNTVGYIVKKISKAAMLMDFKNAAMFSVVRLAIDIHFHTVRNLEFGNEAAYALSLKVENTLWMQKFYALDSATPRNLDTPTNVYEEDEQDETEPIILNVFQKSPGRFSQEKDVFQEQEDIRYPYNVTLREIYIENLYREVTLMNISVMTDNPHNKRFVKVAKDMPIIRG